MGKEFLTFADIEIEKDKSTTVKFLFFRRCRY